MNAPLMAPWHYLVGRVALAWRETLQLGYPAIRRSKRLSQKLRAQPALMLRARTSWRPRLFDCYFTWRMVLTPAARMWE